MNAVFDTAPATFPTPWAARAFALVNAAAEAGWFELRDFQQTLITSIGARENGGNCIGDEVSYYECWIESLTALLRDKGVASTRLATVEAAIRERPASQAHALEHQDDESPQPIHVEAAR